MVRQKKRFALIVLIAVILTAAGAMAWVFSGNTETFSLSVGNHKVSGEEYLAYMELAEYSTKVQIQQEYGAEYSEGFWEKSYDGRHGYDILSGNAVEALKYIRAVYDIAEENQDVSDGDYKALKERWEKENARRSRGTEKGEVIYGLKEYTFELYLRYEMSTLKETYCNDSKRDGMKLTEEEIQEHYNSREWSFGEGGEKADLETARIAVERELREQKYDAMVAQRAANSKVDGDMESVGQFTLKNIE